MKILDSINNTSDLKKLDIDGLNMLSRELRQYIFNIVTENGGHLASNFGIIELTIALLYSFDFPNDKIVWDVGHQSYAYKILTGRRNMFPSLRTYGGIGGFPRISESEYDSFNTGHSSTSISIGLGFARARDILRQKHNVVSVIGDGALTGGMAFEALNDLGVTETPMLVILNDNNMSISKNVGIINKTLNNLRIKNKYYIFKKNLSQKIKRFPIFGRTIYKILDSSKELLKRILIKDLFFNYFKLHYIGPIDGHDIGNLIKVFDNIKGIEEPLVLHVVTKKGKGLKQAENTPDKFHGIASKIEMAETYPSFSNALGTTLCDMADEKLDIAVVSAAMVDGTGLKEFQQRHNDKLFDVGIAEQHAVALCAGMAQAGVKPYCAIYSTFLQRSYDQIAHDVCLNKLPVVFCVDRAGISGSDGATHNGLLDISFMNSFPNMTMYAPKNVDDFKQALKWSYNFNAPLSIRYPKNCRFDFNNNYIISYGKWEKIIFNNKSRISVLCVGDRMLDIAYRAASKLNRQGKLINIINACFVKPLDNEMLMQIKNHNIITMEDNVISGGFGESVLSFYNNSGGIGKIDIIGLADCFVEHGSVDELLSERGITVDGLIDRINKLDKLK